MMQTKPQPALSPGFTNPVFDAQSVFRHVLAAMSRPGRIEAVTTNLRPPAPLYPTTAGLLLALADFETAIWLDPGLADATEYVRFHTGARMTQDPGEANFAVIADVAAMPPFTAFAQGTAEYPDRSATLILQAASLQAEGQAYSGPGISGSIAFSFTPQPMDFAARVAANREAFPCGVDLVVCSQTSLAALPRSISLGGC